MEEHEFVDAEGNHWKALLGDILFRTHPPIAAEPMLESRAAAAEILRLAEENARLRAFVTEWSERFGFLALANPQDSFESIDEVARLLCTEIAERGRFVLDMKEALGRLEAAVNRACGSVHLTPPAQGAEEPADTSAPAPRS